MVYNSNGLCKDEMRERGCTREKVKGGKREVSGKNGKRGLGSRSGRLERKYKRGIDRE